MKIFETIFQLPGFLPHVATKQKGDTDEQK